MNVQSWKPAICNCVIYTHTDGRQYYNVKINPNHIKFTKKVKEVHCNHHPEQGQSWVTKVLKEDFDITRKYFVKGSNKDVNTPSVKLKLKDMALEKSIRKAAS